MAPSDPSSRVEATRAALAGDALAIDAQLDPEGAARALAGDAPLWLRVAAAPGPGTQGYLGVPTERAWFRVVRGLPTLEPLEVAGLPIPRPAKVRAVALVEREVAWGTSAAPLPKTIARVVLRTEGGLDLDVASAIADEPPRALGALRALASALADRLGVPPEVPEGDPSPAVEAGASPEDVRSLLRWTLGWEEDRLVLRDLASRGPREGAGVWVAVVIASSIGAVVSAALTLQLLEAGQTWRSWAPRAGITAVFALGAFAFFHVARHALRYRAVGAPVAVFADDRVVAAPWVSREGAIDPRPEGRFGAGVRVHEINRVHVAVRKGSHVVSLDTEHGPIDLTDADGAEPAERLRAIVERCLAGVASARKRKPTAARARAPQIAAAPRSASHSE